MQLVTAVVEAQLGVTLGNPLQPMDYGVCYQDSSVPGNALVNFVGRRAAKFLHFFSAAAGAGAGSGRSELYVSRTRSHLPLDLRDTAR